MTSTPPSSSSAAIPSRTGTSARCSTAWRRWPTSSTATPSSSPGRSRARNPRRRRVLPPRRVSLHRRPHGAVRAARAGTGDAGRAARWTPIRRRITHLIVASCTGFSAPGLDFQIMRAAGLPDSTQRTIVGFMGCFAAVNALKLADQIVRADPRSRVLVVNLELSQPAFAGGFPGRSEDAELPAVRRRRLGGAGDGGPGTASHSARFQAAVIPRSARADHLAYRRHRFPDAPVRPGAGPHPPLAAGTRRRAAAAGIRPAVGGACRRAVDPGFGAAGAAPGAGRAALSRARCCATTATCPRRR